MHSFFKNSIFIILLLSIQSAFGQSQPIELPLQFNTGNPAPYGLPSTVISIQGKLIPILFDTGASKAEIVLSEQALKGLQVKFTGKEVCFTAMDGKHCQLEFIIPEVKLGSLRIKSVRGLLMAKLWGGGDEGFHATEASENGVIGYGLISQFNVLLDYKQNRVTLYPKGEYPEQYDFSKWITIPFTGHLRTKVILNGKPVVLLWDTGAVPSVIYNKNITKDAQLADLPVNSPYNGKRIITKTFTTDNGVTLQNTWFLVKKPPKVSLAFDGLVGENFYRDNLVFIDFSKNKIHVKN